VKERKGTEKKQPEMPARRKFFRLAGGAMMGVFLSGLHMNSRGVRSAAGRRVILTDACTGCTGCAAICPESAIMVYAGRIEVIEERCSGCGYCVVACPVAAVRYRNGN